MRLTPQLLRILSHIVGSDSGLANRAVVRGIQRGKGTRPLSDMVGRRKMGRFERRYAKQNDEERYLDMLPARDEFLSGFNRETSLERENRIGELRRIMEMLGMTNKEYQSLADIMREEKFRKDFF